VVSIDLSKSATTWWYDGSLSGVWRFRVVSADLISGDPVFFPRGVAAADRSAGFMSDTLGGILAVDLDAGAVLWQTADWSTPLIWVGDQLAAARLDSTNPARLSVGMLDITNSGRPSVLSNPFRLPETVSVTDVGTDDLMLDAQIHRGRLFVYWASQSRYAGGAAPPAAVLESAAHRDDGIVVINLASGRARAVTDDAARARFRPELSPRRPRFDPSADPWLVGTRVVKLDWAVQGSELELFLVSSDASGGETRRTPLARGRALVARVTPDGRSIFVHQEEPEPRPGPWRSFSAETGELVATITHDPHADSPCVLNGRVYYLSRQTDGTPGREAIPDAAGRPVLKAREMATDHVLWELPLPERPRRPPSQLRL
jgi:hypothetical protein